MIGPTRSVSIQDYRALVGKELGVSDWLKIDQDAIDQFAALTGDAQPIHIDPGIAAMTPFGQTIAHGFLVLSMLTTLSYQVVPAVSGSRMGVNYGFDRVRFVKPVLSGNQIRGRFTLAALEDVKPGTMRTRLSASVEQLSGKNGSQETALIADWICMTWLDEATGAL